jgi:hypothetical protein
MSLTLRRLLNYLPFPHGSRGAQYLKPTWHKPTPFDQWRSQAPFQTRPSLRTDHFGRGLRRQRLIRWSIRSTIAFAVAWIIWESLRAIM